MLIDFSVSNFYSFKKETHIWTYDGPYDENNICSGNINKKVAIFGNNAAGKSTMIKALSFLKHFVNDPDFHLQNPITHWAKQDEPTEMKITIETGNNQYRYSVTIRSVGKQTDKISKRLFSFETIDESLEKRDFQNKDGRKVWKKIFSNDRDGDSVSEKWFENKSKLVALKKSSFKIQKQIEYLEKSMEDIPVELKKEYDSLLRQIKKIERENIKIEPKRNEFLPELYTRTCQTNHIRTSRASYYNSIDDVRSWFTSSLIILDTDDFHYPLDNNLTLSNLSSIVRSFDTDIVRIDWIDAEKAKKYPNFANYLKMYKKNISPKNLKRKDKCKQLSIEDPAYVSIILKQDEELNKLSYWGGREKHELLAVHSKDDKYIGPISNESDGTRRIIELASTLLPTKTSKVFIIDELDRRLHSLLTWRFIELYNSMSSANKQLIITTHETHIMTTELWSPEEIWFVTKINGDSSIHKLTDAEYPQDMRLEEAYLSGKIEYGCLSKINKEKNQVMN